MKKKKLFYPIFILSLISIITFIGCQQDESFDNLYDNKAYLSFQYNVNFDQLAQRDWEIISQAFSRLNIRENEDGLYEISQNSGKDINISEELFNYLQTIIENSNKRILSDIHFSRSRVQTRQEGGNSNTDCVAYSIASATGQSYEAVNSWITNTYGNNGVPADKFYSVMNHFIDSGSQVSLPNFYNMDIPFGYKNKYVIVIGASHAVNVISKENTNIIYSDAQNGSIGYCSASNVTHVYEIR